MKITHIKIVVFAMASLILVFETLAQRPTAEKSPSAALTSEVLSAVKALQDAGLRRDVSALEQLYSTDYFHTNPDGSMMQREDVLASYRAAPDMSFSSSEDSEHKIIARKDFAVVNERLALHGKTAEGDPFISSYRVTYVLQRHGQRWQCINSHSSLLGIDKHPKQ